jgi:hypothetical protein
MKRPTLVSSLSASFRKATLPENAEEAKLEHRATVRNLIDTYFEDLAQNKVEGIRNAKELAEIIKLDLLLMGDVTERTEQLSELDEVKINKVAELIDLDDPHISDLLANMMKELNKANDDADMSVAKKGV